MKRIREIVVAMVIAKFLYDFLDSFKGYKGFVDEE
jgi:hypothetical protein